MTYLLEFTSDLEKAGRWPYEQSKAADVDPPWLPEAPASICSLKGAACCCAALVPTTEDLNSTLPPKYTPKEEVGDRRRWVSIGLGVCTLLACFLVGLDDSIISTALPTIAAEFKSLAEIGWYGSAYFLPQAVLQPCFGKLYMAWKIRTTYMLSLLIFETGSVISALAPNSAALIVGRAVSGIGAAGICVGGFNILATHFSEQEQKLMLGAVAAILAISNALGPVLGGILTEHASWRWCFGINLPIGILILLGIWTFLPCDKRQIETLSWPWRKKLRYLDLFGTALLTATLLCLLSGVQMLATRTSHSPIFVVLFVFSAVSALGLILQQRLRQSESLLPRRIFRQRNVWALGGFLFFLMSSLANHVYFLPMFLQSLFGLSPSESGFRTVPYLVSICIGTAITVVAMNHMRYLNPFLIAGSLLLSAAAALITTLGMHSSTVQVVCYQVLAGAGIGFCMLSIVIIPQAAVSKEDLPRAQSIIQMVQTVGQTLSTQFTTVVLYGTLRLELETIPLSPAAVSIALADLKTLQRSIPASLLPAILEKCQLAFQMCFRVGLVTAGIAFVFALCLHWKSNTKKAQGADGIPVETIAPGL